MASTINITLVGIGGYGASYLDALLDEGPARDAKLVAVVDPVAAESPRWGEFRDRGISVHEAMSDLYRSETPRIDLTVISTPIHLHASQTCLALANGSNVLCEKPLAATAEDAVAVCEAERRHGRFVAVGFQWSFSRAVQRLKADILAGTLGRPKRLRTLVIFPRGDHYYRRNTWAGRTHTPDGTPVFDSPLNNATAHYLHNMLYLLGPTRETARCPDWVEAELYRANDIESFDTAALRGWISEGETELLFYTTHAATDRFGPVCRFEFERATVEYDHADGAKFVARLSDGRVLDYGQPEIDRPEKLWQSIEAARTGGLLACGAITALPHARCVAAAVRSSAGVNDFADSLRRVNRVDDDSITWIDGLVDALKECHERGILPAEAGLSWARSGHRTALHPFSGMSY